MRADGGTRILHLGVLTVMHYKMQVCVSISLVRPNRTRSGPATVRNKRLTYAKLTR